MIRFIVRRKFKDNYNGCELDSFETYDIDVPELESVLSSGGSGESGYDVSTLAGIEIIDKFSGEMKAKRKAVRDE